MAFIDILLICLLFTLAPREGGREERKRERESSHLLLYFPNAKTRIRDSVWVFHMGGRNPTAFSQGLLSKKELEAELGLKPRHIPAAMSKTHPYMSFLSLCVYLENGVTEEMRREGQREEEGWTSPPTSSLVR